MIKRLAFIEIVVNNFETSLTWYTTILGFKLSGEIISNEDGRWCRLATEDGDDRLALWQPTQIQCSDEKEHSSFVPVFVVDDLQALVDLLLAINPKTMLEGIRERDGYRITTIADPEKNRLQLIEIKTSI